MHGGYWFNVLVPSGTPGVCESGTMCCNSVLKRRRKDCNAEYDGMLSVCLNKR
jgi:hypothetical protein